ncbi:hypothetical protein ACFORO_14865 [Amycolatopsis halotolerans]|uniref:Uncharacterized protein n=1 Tax=Amycolatopsis halotolerans TaxID=330083 RepID=A0ABV7QGS8_9PSEU
MTWDSPLNGDAIRWFSDLPTRGETGPSRADWSFSGETTRAPEPLSSRSTEPSARVSSIGGSPRRGTALPRNGESPAAAPPGRVRSGVPPLPLDGEAAEPLSPFSGETFGAPSLDEPEPSKAPSPPSGETLEAPEARKPEPADQPSPLGGE